MIRVRGGRGSGPVRGARGGLLWAVLFGGIAFVAVTGVAAARDAYERVPEVVTPCLEDPTATCEEATDAGFRLHEPDWCGAFAAGAVAALGVAVVTAGVRVFVAARRQRLKGGRGPRGSP